MADYERQNEPLPVIGQMSAVLSSAGQRVAVIEVTEVRVVRLARKWATPPLARPS
jgi:uncharacterized protein YhfF